MSDNNFTIRIVTVPMLDTGIGRAAGYNSDRELMDAAAAERAALPEATRAILDDLDARHERAFLFGDDRGGG